MPRLYGAFRPKLKLNRKGYLKLRAQEESGLQIVFVHRRATAERPLLLPFIVIAATPGRTKCIDSSNCWNIR